MVIIPIKFERDYNPLDDILDFRKTMPRFNIQITSIESNTCERTEKKEQK